MPHKRKQETFLKEVAAPSIEEAIIKMDEWGKSVYDMYLVEFTDYSERPGYIQMIIYGWENASSRERFSV